MSSANNDAFPLHIRPGPGGPATNDQQATLQSPAPTAAETLESDYSAWDYLATDDAYALGLLPAPEAPRPPYPAILVTPASIAGDSDTWPWLAGPDPPDRQSESPDNLNPLGDHSAASAPSGQPQAHAAADPTGPAGWWDRRPAAAAGSSGCEPGAFEDPFHGDWPHW
jgi:hypothetical protein